MRPNVATHEPHPDELCGGWCRTYAEVGYAYCRPCGQWHRPPECVIDERGVSELDLTEGVS